MDKFRKSPYHAKNLFWRITMYEWWNPPKRCNGCNKKIPDSPRTYCSEECRKEFYHKIYLEEHPPIEKECKGCKRTFKTPHKKEMYCSPLCKAEHVTIEANKKWAAKTPKKRKKQQLNMQMFYELRDRPSDSALKKYNACRG